MGWLRDLMSSARPPVRSFGELARRAQQDSGWPADLEIRPRSFATLLSKLDREEQLLWLADRPRVQEVLARVLSTVPDAVRPPLPPVQGDVEPARDNRLLRLNDLPGARPLDLVREPLPPGIPERLTRPDGPALWWIAPSGAGRSLLGRWLKARGRAEFLTAPSWAELAERVPDGPVFVELLTSEGGAPAARPGLCVAAPFPPTGPGFEVVTSPPLPGVVDALIDWALRRLPGDTRLEREPARTLLVERMDEEIVTTFGEALGWLGLLDELGAREVGKAVGRNARRFVERRVADVVDPASPHAGWLRRSIHRLLLGMVERALTDSDLPITAPRDVEAWMALVPPDVERAVDVEWVRLSLARVESAVRPAELERAARQLPPGAYRVVSTLERAGLLTRHGEELRLEPAWLRAALTREAVTALVTRSPFEWGEAVVRDHAAAAVAAALLERTRAIGGSALEPVLDLDAEDQPAYAAAVDVAFRVAGVARLVGADIGLEVLEGLLGETARLVVERPGELPAPRIALGCTTNESATAEHGRALLHPGTFYLAALSATEAASTRAPRLGPLDPWHGSSVAPELARAYDAIVESLRLGPPWRDGAFALVQRARSSIGNVRHPDAPHPLERPAQILDEIVHGVLAWETLDADGELWLPPLFALAERRHVSRATVARAFWQAWDEAGQPANMKILSPTTPFHAELWAEIPEALLERWLLGASNHAPPYAAFGAEQWRAFARALAGRPMLVCDESAWEHVPRELAVELVRAALPWQRAPGSLRVLWRRFPDALLALTRDHVHGARGPNPTPLEALLGSVPDEAAQALIAELRAVAPGRAIHPTAVPALRELLLRLLRERRAGWREAYALLSQLERELRRVAL